MESSESTKILIDSCRVFLKYAKREQVEGMLMLAGWSDTQCKLRNFTLYGGRKHETTMFSFLCEVRYSPLEFHP